MNPSSHNAVQSPLRKGGPLPRVLRWFSSQCVLRQVDTADVARIWQAVLHPAYGRCWTAPIPNSEADVADFVRAAQADWARGTRYVLAVHRRQTQEFVGWIEARAHESVSHRGVWQLDWFIHPGFVTSSLALEALVAASDLMMNALGARVLSVDCPASHALFETVLRTAGFSQHVPAGSLDPASGAPRAQSLFAMTQRDWLAARRTTAAEAPATLGGYTTPKLELSLL
jgi:RimJ/RimL family protein N-acetyltransferase